MSSCMSALDLPRRARARVLRYFRCTPLPTDGAAPLPTSLDVCKFVGMLLAIALDCAMESLELVRRQNHFGGG
jgi:hypothetical protein